VAKGQSALSHAVAPNRHPQQPIKADPRQNRTMAANRIKQRRQGGGGGSSKSFSEEAAAEKHMAQLQHNIWVTNSKGAALSVITGGGKWVEIKISADPLYQHVLLTAEKKFWRCVENGEPPRLYGAEPPRPRIEAIRIVDMNSSNTWAEFSNVFRRTREAYLEHENAKAELKELMPEDAKEAIGHGIRAKRSKAGAVSFEVLNTEASHAPVQ
jgi:predicted phage-related endonuclease